MLIPLFKPTLKRKDMDSVLTCMVSDRLAPGIYNEQYVAEFARLLGCAGGIALGSYYSAISLAFASLNLKPEDKVVLSPLAPSLYMAVLQKQKLQAILVDVDPHSGLISQSELEKALTHQPKVIVCHHTLGYVYNMALLATYGLPIIEDVSQALGGSWQDKPVGSFGNLVVASLDEQSIITAGCGGIVLARKKTDTQQLKRLLEQNIQHPLLSDLNASVALAQLHELNNFVETRREISRIYSEALMRSRHATLHQPEEGMAVPYSFPVLVDTGIKEVRQFAKKKGIMTGAAYNETIITMDDVIYNSFPQAKSLLLKCLLFPLYPMLGRSNIALIAKVLAALP